MPARKGDTWNESETYKDAWTLREVRRITTQGLYNQTPTYHINITFTEDSEFLVFASARDGKSAVYRAHVPTGDITQLIDPIDGVGGYGSLHKANGVTAGNGMGIDGGHMSIAPRTGWLTFVAGRTLRAVHIQTLEERTLVEDIGPEWTHGVLSVDPTETYVIVALMSAHPEILAGQRSTRPYMTHFAEGQMQLRIIQVPLAGGAVETIYSEDGCSSAHSPHCPTDPDLVLIDRDFPPRFWGGSDGKTNRIWTLRLSTGELTELPPQDEARFQVHSGWTWDGEHVIYHGRSAVSGHYIGVVDKQGNTVREYAFRDAPHYGHVSAMAGRPAIILDGNITNDMLLWLYYDAEQPRVEAIARHNTNWGALPGQYPHPHPVSDSQGRWISFNVGQSGRTDVCVVKV
ncbi:MAG: hypothetical protein CL610_14705 [Anaerolineaceae bacterium]|nr:hypothetical protein [Anaerolineaceae bacterium]